MGGNAGGPLPKLYETDYGFHATVRVFGAELNKNSVWKYAETPLLTGFKTELEGACRASGFGIILRRTYLRKNGTTYARFICAKGKPYEPSGSAKKTERKAKRRRDTRPALSARPADKKDCCQWQVEVILDPRENRVIVNEYQDAFHNHSFKIFRYLPLKLMESHRARVLELAQLQALSSSQIAAIVRRDIEREGGPEMNEVYICARALAYVTQTDTERSVTRSLQEIVRNPHHVLWARDEETGKECVLRNVDASALSEARPLTETELRTQRHEARNKVDEKDVDNFASAAVAMVQDVNAALKKNPRALQLAQKQLVAADQKKSGAAPKGSGNHGVTTPPDWVRFTLSEKTYVFLAAGWIDPESFATSLLCALILICDDTFCKNKYRIPIFNGVTQDGDNRTIPFIKAFVMNESYRTFQWIYTQAIPALYGKDWCKKVLLIVVDGDPQQLSAIKVALGRLFIHAAIALCRVHAIQKPVATLHTGIDGSPTRTAKAHLKRLLSREIARASRSADDTRDLLDLARWVVEAVASEQTFTQAGLAVVDSVEKHIDLIGAHNFHGLFQRMRGRTTNAGK